MKASGWLTTRSWELVMIFLTTPPLDTASGSWWRTGIGVYLGVTFLSLERKLACGFLASVRGNTIGFVISNPLPPWRTTPPPPNLILSPFRSVVGASFEHFCKCWKAVFSRLLFLYLCQSHFLLSHVVLLKVLRQAGFNGSWPSCHGPHIGNDEPEVWRVKSG